MSNLLKFTLGALLACLLASCAEQPTVSKLQPLPARSVRVACKKCGRPRTRTRSEAVAVTLIGTYLSGNRVMSAASDWSRFPLGTRFRIVDTNEQYIIDDYGTALVGTNTIDLYKTSRLEMRRWGVRHVDIDILQWGSPENSLRVLTPRKKHRQVRQMIVALQKNPSRPAARVFGLINGARWRLSPHEDSCRRRRRLHRQRLRRAASQRRPRGRDLR